MFVSNPLLGPRGGALILAGPVTGAYAQGPAGLAALDDPSNGAWDLVSRLDPLSGPYRNQVDSLKLFIPDQNPAASVTN